MSIRALFFVSSFQVGGAERQSIQVAAGLQVRGYDSRFLCFHPTYSATLVDESVLARTRFTRGGRMSNPLRAIEAWKLISEIAPDVIVAVGTSSLRLAIAGRALGRYRIPIVCTYHMTVPIDRNRLRHSLFRHSVRFADCLVYVSENQRRFWESRGLRSRHVEVIHNGVDATYYASGSVDRDAARLALGFATSDFVVGLCATFRPEKNHRQLVDAVALLRTRGVPARALFVGDGRTRDGIEAHARQSGMTAYVAFAGEQRDVRPFIAAMDVGVLCSTSVETLSLAALETMSMGVPMVMSDTGGASEIVESGADGLLFPVGDTPALVDRLLYLAADATRRRDLGHAAAAKVHRAFTDERMIDRYDVLLRSVVG